MNTLNPLLMSGEERRAEIIGLLAVAILRLRQSQASGKTGKSAVTQLDYGGVASLHVPRIDR